MELMNDAGFADVKRFDDTYYQPVLVGTRPCWLPIPKAAIGTVNGKVREISDAVRFGRKRQLDRQSWQ